MVGARPQFVKLAAVDKALREQGHTHLIVHTGQHYDPLMSQAFFDDLGISAPAVNLGVGSRGPAGQTAGILAGLEPVLESERPDWAMVYGDTNSTLAGALGAAQGGIPLAHLEAGLRCFDRRMPEERNRVVADHVSDLLFAPSAAAVRNLADEGLGGRAVLVGDVGVEVLARTRDRVSRAPADYLPAILRAGPYLLATLHREQNTDDPDRLSALLDALASCPLPVMLLAHPRLAERAGRLGRPLAGGALHACDPLPYPAMIAALLTSRGLVTDSGGLQKEAVALGVPCTTLRSRTEWPETLQGGWNVLVSQPRDLVPALLRPCPAGKPPQPYGDGGAAERVVSQLLARVGSGRVAGERRR